MTERDFWLTVRRGLLTISKAIETRYLSKDAPTRDVDDMTGIRVVSQHADDPPKPGDLKDRYPRANKINR